MTSKKRTGSKGKPKRLKRLKIEGLTVEQALRKAMSVPPPKDEKKPQKDDDESE